MVLLLQHNCHPLHSTITNCSDQFWNSWINILINNCMFSFYAGGKKSCFDQYLHCNDIFRGYISALECLEGPEYCINHVPFLYYMSLIYTVIYHNWPGSPGCNDLPNRWCYTVKYRSPYYLYHDVPLNNCRADHIAYCTNDSNEYRFVDIKMLFVARQVKCRCP